MKQILFLFTLILFFSCGDDQDSSGANSDDLNEIFAGPDFLEINGDYRTLPSNTDNPDVYHDCYNGSNGFYHSYEHNIAFADGSLNEIGISFRDGVPPNGEYRIAYGPNLGNSDPIWFKSFGRSDCDGLNFPNNTEGKVFVDRINGKISIFWDLVRSLPDTDCNEIIRGKSTCPN